MNEEVKHTPGPWEAAYRSSPYRKEIYANGVAIATVWRSGTGNQIHATARLMAAAPEMLAALKKVRSEVDLVAYPSVFQTVHEIVEKAEGK